MDITKMPLPFYSLEQAVSILNEDSKYKIFDTKSLILMALNYDFKLHVLFTGSWNVICDLSTPFLHVESDTNDKLKHDILYNSIKDIIQSDTNVCGGGLFELEKYALACIFNNDNTHIFEFGFANFIPVTEVFTSYKSYIKDALHNLKTLGDITKSDIDNVFIHAIYLNSDVEESSTFDIKLRPKNMIEQDFGENDIAFLPLVTLDDIFITHLELNKILDGSLQKKQPIFNSDDKVKNISELKVETKTRGVSKAKLNAKLAAQTLADYLWRQDKDKRIKIKDMSMQVYAELYNTEHRGQLPNDQISIKDWIAIVADKYPHARLSGRTTK